MANTAASRTPIHHGQPFNPRWAFDIMIIPRGLARRTELTGDAKLLYCRMAALATNSGVCWAKQQTLADAIGCSVRSVKTHIATLEEYGLIAVVQRGRNLTNEYRFLRHPWIEDASDDASDEDQDPRSTSVGNVQDLHPRSAESALPLPMSSGSEVGSYPDTASRRRAKINKEPDQGPDPEPEQARGGTVRRRTDRRQPNVHLASEPALGADARIERRDFGWTLMGEFISAAYATYPRHKLAFGVGDKRMLAQNIAEWLRGGATGGEVRAMIELFMLEPLPNVGLARAFVGARHRLSADAARVAESRRPAAERYRDPEPEAPRPAPEFHDSFYDPDPPSLDTRRTTRSTTRKG